MANDSDSDLGVDVLIIGGGLLGHYLARQLLPRYSVCLLHDPSFPSEALDAEGTFSAGYAGNDVGRIQPGRRAAGYWRLWSESNGVPRRTEPSVVVLDDDDVRSRTQLWADASLGFAPTELPPILASGTLATGSAFTADDDVVMDPADVIAELRVGLEDCWLEGDLTKMALAGDVSLGYIEVEVDREPLAIVPRFTVLAASSANADLLYKLAVRLRDVEKRKVAVEAARSCQAVRKRTVVCVRGDLPSLAGQFGDLRITSHTATASTDTIWLVNPPIDDAATTLGSEKLRFEPPLDSAVVARTVDALFACSPAVAALAPELSWSAYARRKAEHPMMATPDISNIGQPSPAKIETLGLDGLLALWPSHLSYTMIVGDVAAERIRASLGESVDESTGLQLADLPLPAFDPRARWDRPDFPWQDWTSFADAHDFKSEP